MRLGGHLTEETKTKLSASMIETWKLPEARSRMIAGQMGQKHFLGHRHSEETRAKMCATRGGSLNPDWKGGKQVSQAKQGARRRLLGFVSLNEPFTGSEGHHVDNEQVIYMPHSLHRSVYHRQTDGRGMAQINAIAYNFLFKQEAEAALGGKL